MSEVPVSGDEPPDDDAIEGQVVPFPGVMPAPAKPQRGGQPGELRDIIPPHLRTWQGIAKALQLALPARPPSRPVPRGQVAQAARPHRRVGARRRRPDRVRATRLVVGQSSRRTSGTRPSRRTTPQKWLSLHKHVRAVRLVRGCILGRRGPRPGARRRGGDLVPAGAVAAHRAWPPCRCWRGSGGPRTSRS